MERGQRLFGVIHDDGDNPSDQRDVANDGNRLGIFAPGWCSVWHFLLFLVINAFKVKQLIPLMPPPAKHYFLLLILLFEIVRCRLHLWRPTPKFLFFRCLVDRFCTRFRHIFQLLRFISCRISSITLASGTPNWNSIASKGVRSSHAISLIRFTSLSDSLYTFLTFMACKQSHHNIV